LRIKNYTHPHHDDEVMRCTYREFRRRRRRRRREVA
jgi:hypothetical protein